MATAQSGKRTSSRAKTTAKKAVAARAAKEELKTAQESAGNLVSAVRSSATNFGRHLGRTATHQVAAAANEVQHVRQKTQDRVRENPLLAVGVATGVGLLLGIVTRR